MARVDLENVSRVFPGGVVAVEEMNLTVEDEELLVLLGPSGSGKSTTLRMIAGLEEVSSGEIRIGGRSVNGAAPKDRDVAMVFQNFALYPHLSVQRNLAFGLELRWGVSRARRWLWRALWPRRGRIQGERRAEIDERVRETAGILGIEGLLNRMPDQLSGGQRQRVALGRAIVRQPAVLLLDEPLSNLDARLRSETRGELKALHQRLKATMIYVTHDQTEALTLGDRIAVMNKGRIQQLAAPVEIYRQPANRFVAGFIGSPPMNFLSGRLEEESSGMWRFTWRGGSLRLENGRWRDRRSKLPCDVELGIRPESIRLQGELSGEGLSRPLPAIVHLVERIGDEVVAHLEIGDPKDSEEANPQSNTTGEDWILSKSSGGADVREGEQVQVVIDTHSVHLFDPATGENLATMGGG